MHVKDARAKIDENRSSKQQFVGAPNACLTLAMIAGEVRAQTASVDWKLYGAGAFEPGRYSACFYDANGIVRRPDGHLRVWTKCLLQSDIDSIDIEKDFGGQIARNTARKFIDNYRPPITTIEVPHGDQLLNFMLSEEAANIADIEPNSRIFYELNCAEQVLRGLSIYVRTANGRGGSLDKPSEWHYIPPEGNGARLLKLLCAARL